MPTLLDPDRLESRIILLLIETYPVTLKDISNYLDAPKRKVDKAIQLLIRKKLIGLEPLPDNTFVTLISNDFRFTKMNGDVKRIVEKLKQRQQWTVPDDDNSVMYG